MIKRIHLNIYRCKRQKHQYVYLTLIDFTDEMVPLSLFLSLSLSVCIDTCSKALMLGFKLLNRLFCRQIRLQWRVQKEFKSKSSIFSMLMFILVNFLAQSNYECMQFPWLISGRLTMTI